MCAVCCYHCAYASRDTPTAFWKQADQPDLADKVGARHKIYLQWQTLQRKGALSPYHLHPAVRLEQWFAQHSHLHDGLHSQAPAPFPETRLWCWGAAKLQGAAGGPQQPNTPGRMRMTLAVCSAVPSAGSWGWTANCPFSFFSAEGAKANIL